MNKIERILSLAIICILPILPSCLPTVYTPEYKMLRKIEDMPYLNNKFNCVDKAILYHRHLQKNDIESRVVSGKIDGHKVNHSWVEAYSPPNDSWFMQDPTWPNNVDGFELKHYPERKVWFVYGSDVTKEDIINERNITKHIWENIPELRQGKIRKRIESPKKISSQ